MAGIKTYDPSKVNLVAAGLTLTGFGPGTFIRTKKTTVKRYESLVGAKGEVSRTKNPDESGMIEVDLKITSPSNTYLSLLAQQPIAFPIFLTDKSTGFSTAVVEAWIEEEPEDERGDKEAINTWKFGCADLTKVRLEV
jgi:hypothetical protein